jgi:type VI secretion system secreted protein VgrG
MQITVAGEDAGKTTQHISINQVMYGHHTFELHQSMEDRSSGFINMLHKKTGAILGKSVEIKFGKSNKFKGIITSVSVGRAAKGSSVIIIRGQSPTISLDNGPHTLSYYEKPFQAIIDEASKTYKGSFEKAPDYMKKLKYIVQHRESNFDFLVRMAARYGQWFFYDGDKLYLGKKPNSSSVELGFQRDIKSMDLGIRSIPVNFDLHSHDYKVGGKNDHINKKPEYEVQNKYAQIAYNKAKGDIFPDTPKGVYNQYTSKEDLDHFVKVQSDAQASEMVFLNAFCTTKDLKVGTAVHLIDRREELGGDDDYGEYIITGIVHSFTLQGDKYFDYHNQFQAIPKESKVPPIPGSIHPPASEMQVGVVTDINDKKSLGRVRVRLNSQAGQEKTPWIRVASPYPGKTKGVYINPEIGDQVVVAFENNNPERPYVLTGFYNAEDKPQHFHTENHNKAIKTKGGHEILMYDEKGKEKFSIFSPKEVTIRADTGTMTQTAKQNITIESETANITIKCPETITIQAKHIIIKGKDSIKMESKDITIDASNSLKASAKTIDIDADTNNSMSAGAKFSIDGTASTVITGGVIKLN